ncbi:MAG: NifB/NifX family molybdenum-iron cluster-binding protein [Acidobacteria bacterium]|nr:NifB/NifX family molybdenum-iron cluster-binding protein [Acidobacteriota bacterium]
MKIAISSTGASLDAEAEPRFGRCPYFIIADTETGEFTTQENSNAMAAGGAGIATAQAIADKGVQAVLTGHCGPNAYQVLSAAGIQIITGVSGKIKDIIEDYRAGKFKRSQQADVPDHYGAGSAPGSGGGGGMGRGMGMGKGCGRGRGMAGGMTPPAEPATPPSRSGQDLQELKNQAQTIAQQLADIQRRIQEMEKK